jgi:hypothetical protein
MTDLLAHSAPGQSTRTALELVLPGHWLDIAYGGTSDGEELEHRREKLAALVLAMLRAQVPSPLLSGEARVSFGGSPQFASALTRAQAILTAGQAERCIVGGVESLVGRTVLSALHQAGMLKTPDHPTGLVPGEAAGFVALEHPQRAARRGVGIHATIDRIATSRDPESPRAKANTGRNLADVVSRVMGRGHSPRLSLIADLNGTTARAQEWGTALVHLRGQGVEETDENYPARSFGEIGCATGPAAVCLAARAFARGHAPSSREIVWLWDDDGERAALCVAAPP